MKYTEEQIKWLNSKQQQAYKWAKSQDYPSVAAKYARELASAVDGLQSRIAELEGITFWAQNRYLKEQVAEMQAQLERVRKESNYKQAECDYHYGEAMKWKHECDRLEAQLAASQQETRAAVEDMKRIVDAVRGEHGDETCCLREAYTREGDWLRVVLRMAKQAGKDENETEN